MLQRAIHSGGDGRRGGTCRANVQLGFAICTIQVMAGTVLRGVWAHDMGEYLGREEGGLRCTSTRRQNWGEGCDYWGNSRPCCSLYRVALGLAAGQELELRLGLHFTQFHKILRVTLPLHNARPAAGPFFASWSWTWTDFGPFDGYCHYHYYYYLAILQGGTGAVLDDK